MSKHSVRTCVVVLAASLALALTPVASYASGAPARPATSPAHTSWFDATVASIGALIHGLPPASSMTAKHPASQATKVPHWLKPTCGTMISPGGSCG